MRLLGSKRLGAVIGAFIAGLAVVAVGFGAVWSQGIMADGTNVRLRVIRTVANDFDSGWHIHPGPAIVQVEEGSFQIFQDSCTPRTVTAGQTFIEVPYVPVRAIASGKVVWTTTLMGQYEASLNSPVTSPCP